MSKFVNGQRYDTDFFPIDDQGNRIGDRDLGASDTWTNANEPWRNTPGWHGQPLSAEQAAGRQQADPAAWAAREQWRAANPTDANGRPLAGAGGGTGGGTGGGATGGNNAFQFDWGGWNVGGGQGGGGNEFFTGGDWAQTYGGPQATTNTQRGGRADPAAGAPNVSQFGPPQQAQGDVPNINGNDQIDLTNMGGGQGRPNYLARGRPQAGGMPAVSDFGPPQEAGGGGSPVSFYGPPEQQGGGVRGRPQQQRPPQSQYAQTGYYGAPELDGPALLSQLGQGVQSSIMSGLADPSVDQNSPAYRAAVESNNRNVQRSTDRRRAQEAQRAHAGGTLSSGGFNSRVSGLLEDQGNQEADFEAGLMQSELAAGRDRQARAQQLGAGLLSQEQQQDLQSRLANQGSRLQTNSLNNQRDLGMGQLDLGNRSMNNDMILRRNALMLQQQLGLSDLDLRRLGLTNQNSQYYAGLGQQLGLGQAQLNQQALLALLGG